MRRKLPISLLCQLPLVLAWITNTPVVRAGAIFQTGFEPPTYSTGSLARQDGWTSNDPPEVTVQNSVVFVGAQAVQIDAGGLFAQTRGSHPLSYVAAGSPESIVRAEVDFQISASGDPSTWSVLSAFGGGLFIGQIWVRTNGTAAIGVGPTGFGSLPVTRGEWNHFELVLDPSSQTQSAYYNGQIIAKDVPFANAATTLNSVGFSMNSHPGTDIGYWDNYAVVSAAPIAEPVPEPAAFWLLAPALGGLLLVHRKQAARRNFGRTFAGVLALTHLAAGFAGPVGVSALTQVCFGPEGPSRVCVYPVCLSVVCQCVRFYSHVICPV